MELTSTGVTSRMQDILRQSQELRERSRDMMGYIPGLADAGFASAPVEYGIETNPDRSPVRRSPLRRSPIPPAPDSGIAFPASLVDLNMGRDTETNIKELATFHKRVVKEYEDKIISLEAELHGARGNIKTCEAAHNEVVAQLRTIMDQIRMGGLSLGQVATQPTEPSPEAQYLQQELNVVKELNEQLKQTIGSKDRLLAALNAERHAGTNQSTRDVKHFKDEAHAYKQQLVEVQTALVTKEKEMTDRMEVWLKEKSHMLLKMKSLEEEIEQMGSPASPAPTPMPSATMVAQTPAPPPPPPPAREAPEVSYGDLQVITMPTASVPASCSVSSLPYISIAGHPREVRRALNTVATTCSKVAAQAPILWTGAVGIESKMPREAILLVTDRCIYVVTIVGLVKRCIPLDDISKVLVTKGLVGLVVPSQFDLLVKTADQECVKVLLQVVGARRNDAVEYYADGEQLPKVMRLEQSDFKAGALLPVALLFKTKSSSPTLSAAEAPQRVRAQQPLPGREYEATRRSVSGGSDAPPPPPAWSVPDTHSELTTEGSPSYSNEYSLASPTISTISPRPRLEPPTVTTEELEGLPPQHTPDVNVRERKPQLDESPKKKKPKGYFGATVIVIRPTAKPLFDTINFLGSFTPDVFAEELTKFLSKTQSIMLNRMNFNLHLAPKGIMAGTFSAEPVDQLLSGRTLLGPKFTGKSLQTILQDEGREMNSGAKHIIFVMVHKNVM